MEHQFPWNNNNNNNNGFISINDVVGSSSSSSNSNSNHALMFPYHNSNSSLYSGGSAYPDPHLTCLKLGKRNYFEDISSVSSTSVVTTSSSVVMGELPGLGFPIGKRGRLYGGGSTTTVVVPRCQVEGCHVALLNAKDYHRRHKVCEMHSKSPKVVVLGSEQRFCQQCSRFHAVTEFDEAKRSCRRRLAGHNERRRKSSSEASSRNLSQEHRSTSGRYACLSPSTGRALSLLSSNTTTTSWVSPSDISSRSSAALRELIAENRASVLGRQLFLDQFWSHNDSGEAQPTGVSIPNQTQGFAQPLSEWDRFSEAGAQVTLDLMQAPPSPPPFGYHSRRTAKSKDEEEECCELWKSLEGTHVV